ncbi:Hypothetical protein SRAE_1000289200 [Strongyloides ratti]|uniref:Mitochondrial mRNA-processing protein COX24 C-terminal domain-containing protein n=1 Tax=Strongyloides ratti TaxID=34506 RepID=A0A090MX14_STRRB|nr:Hypothetical protein SRAE_1000289200 [Strongyloides ratti]CEF64639.1 Hypothetical protein SRAE_1000289200 [Strongyloides ratti]
MLQRFNRIVNVRTLKFLTSSPSNNHGILPPRPINGNLNIPMDDHINENNKFTILPGYYKNIKIYSFPELNPKIVEAPTLLNILDKIDPSLNDDILKEIEEPNKKISPMYCSPRLMTIRRKKMNKFKRRKRYDRDYHKYQKHHRQKKIKAERKFRQQMALLIKEMNEFDPLQFVSKTIETAKYEWTSSVAPSGRKKYPHWSQLMTLEEIYGIEKNNYIDKRYGYPTTEDAQQLEQMIDKYLKEYKKKK